MKKSLIFLSFICFLVTIGCKSSPKSTEKVTVKMADPGMQTVSNANYTVDIPLGWTSKTKVSDNVSIFTMVSPPSMGNIYINILTESMKGYNIDDYRAATIKSVMDGMPGTTMLDKGEIEAGDLKGKWFTYQLKSADDELDGINYSFPKNGVAYIVSGSTDIGQMDKFRSKLDSIAKSIRINEE